MQPLKNLPEIYDIKNCDKGHFPHEFNRPENQNYIGKIPPPAAFGKRNMMDKNYVTFHEWYETVKDIEDWNFRGDEKVLCDGCCTVE